MYHDVCVLIVTYNRRVELLNLLNKLDETSSVKNVVIIDNNSSYDIKKSIDVDFINLDISLHILDENTGGSGGFNYGMNYIVKNKLMCNYIWAMDDDGYPSNDCLDNLISAMEFHNCQIIGPVVKDINQTNQLSFTLNYKSNIYSNFDDLPNENYFNDLLNPFNGTLIKTDVIKKYGSTDPRLFIWGDEVEWLWKMRHNNVKFGTSINSIFYHPINRKTYLGLSKLWSIDSHVLGVYCFYRNQVLIRKKYRSKFHTFAWVLRSIVGVLLFSKKKKVSILAITHGLFSIFGKHKDYIK